MNPADTNHWKNKVDWIFDTWWDKILEPQKKKKKRKKKKTFPEKESKKWRKHNSWLSSTMSLLK